MSSDLPPVPPSNPDPNPNPNSRNDDRTQFGPIESDHGYSEFNLSEPVIAQVTPNDPNEFEDDSEPKWLHPSSLVFGIISHARQLVLPILFAVFSAAKGSMFGLWVAAGFFVIALVFTLFRYLTLRYQIKGGDLIVKEGIIFRRVRTVPIRRIQNMDLVQNILHRIFHVAEVKVETASGTEPEAVLRVLTMSQIQALREQVFGGQANAMKPAPSVDAAFAMNPDLTQEEPRRELQAAQPVTLLKIPTSWLIRAGLASNRGGIIIGVIAGFLYQFGLEDYISWNAVRQYIPSFDGSLYYILMVTGFVIAVLLLLRILGTIWYILRFHGYELQRIGEDLRIRCGLFTKVSATVPRKRIQFISVQRSLILRWMGMAVIRIETAGGSGAGNEDAAATVSRKWFVPVIKNELVDGVLAELRPGLRWDPDDAEWVGLSKRAPARMSRLAVILSLLLCVAGFFAYRPWGAIAGLVLAPILVMYAIRKSRSMKYARTAFGVVYRSGIFTKKLSMTFFERIQTLKVNQSPFDRRWKMAKLVVDTAAAGPAEHTINVGYLDESFAKQEFKELMDTSSHHRPNWTG